MVMDTKSRDMTDLRPDSDKTEELISKLREAQSPVAQAFGTGDSLYKMISSAISTRDVRELNMAVAAFHAQEKEFNNLRTSGWGEPRIQKEDADRAACLGKPLRLVLQIDGWDAQVELRAGLDWEPKRFEVPVRVHILAGTSKRDAVVTLENIRRWLDEDWNSLIAQAGVVHELPGKLPEDEETLLDF